MQNFRLNGAALKDEEDITLQSEQCSAGDKMRMNYLQERTLTPHAGRDSEAPPPRGAIRKAIRTLARPLNDGFWSPR